MTHDLITHTAAGMPRFLNSANFLFQMQTSSFRSSTQLVLYYSNFQNFYVLRYICFLSTLIGWTDILSIPHQHVAAFRPSRHFRAYLFSRPFPRIYFFRWARSKIMWLLYDSFRAKQQHITLNSSPAHCSFKSHEVLWTDHCHNYGFICNAIFNCMHVHKSLSNKT